MNKGATLVVLLSLFHPAVAADEQPPDARQNEKEMRRLRHALKLVATSNDMAEVARSVRLLADDFELSRPLLRKAAGHRSWRLRAQAIKVLGERGEAKDDLDVVANALQDRVPAVRMTAVMAIRNLGPTGLPVLGDYVRSEHEPNIRKMAVRTLRRWGDSRAIPVLARLLEREKHRNVRKLTVAALEELSGRNLGDNEDAWITYARWYVEEPNRRRILRYFAETAREAQIMGASFDASEDEKER